MTRANSGRRIAAAALFLQVFALSLFRIYDPDTWWHLKTGEVIWLTKSIPTRDIFSWVIEGRPWITFEWLSQLLFYGVYQIAGPASLITFKALVMSSAYLLVFELGGGSPASILIYSMAVLLTRGFFFERPQMFDFLLVPLFIRLVQGKPERRLFWQLPALEALWANLHGGAALLGAGVVAARGVQAWLEGSGWRRWAALALLCAAGMLANAHGVNVFIQLFETMSFPGKELIQEWSPLQSFFNWYGLYFAAVLAAVAVGFRERPLLSMLALGFGFMAVRSIRYLSFFMLVTCPLLALSLNQLGPFLDELSPTWGAVGEAWRGLRRCWSAASSKAQGVCAAAAVVLLTFYYAERMATHSIQLSGFGLVENPKGAVEYLDRNDVRGRMFNEYGMGGYLIWKSWPKRKVFADGRNVEYGPEFVKSVGTWSRPGGFRSLENQFGFDYAIIINGNSYSCWELDRDPSWALVYFDDAALVYLKREPANEELIKRDAYRLLQPNHLSYGFLDAALADPKRAQSALAEVERAVRTTEANVDAHQMKAYLLAELGRPKEALAAVQDAVDRFYYKPGPYLSLGWYYERTHDLPKAAEAYEKASQLARRENDWVSGSVAFNNWGTVEYRRGDLKKAAHLYRQSLELYPEYGEAKKNLEKVEAKL